MNSHYTIRQLAELLTGLVELGHGDMLAYVGQDSLYGNYPIDNVYLDLKAGFVSINCDAEGETVQ